jgi:hypothetical protein
MTTCGGRTSVDQNQDQDQNQGQEAGVLLPVEPVSAIDILFMVGNWAELGDEQALLAEAVPQLLTQLLRPNCIGTDGVTVGLSELTPDGVVCAEGKPEFKPVNDIHIGIITSSLGNHGAGWECTPGAKLGITDTNGQYVVQAPDVNDQAHLIGSLSRGVQVLDADSTIVQNGLVKLNPLGFLAWGGPSLQVNSMPTSSDLNSATAAFADMVQATHTNGCGLEAQLESWFRFLVDPVPPVLPITQDSQQHTHRTGSDDALLAQRAAFLRSNSLLAIVMLSDENDFSVRDTDIGWVAMEFGSSVPTGSPNCAVNPNDRCCYSCMATPPTGCDACANPRPPAEDDGAFQDALRGYHQKRRFGYEYLYPTSRYYVALTHKDLCPDQTFGDMDCDCTFAKSIGASCDAGSRRMPNPLFSHEMGTDNQGNPVASLDHHSELRKDSSRIFLAGIVGVPWQELSEPESQVPGVTLEYVPTNDPRFTSEHGIWQRIYGDDAANIVPGDPHMIESPAPRADLPGPDSPPLADPANAHEYNSGRFDLQYACVAPLRESRLCQCSLDAVDFSSCLYQHRNYCCHLTFNFDALGGPGGDDNNPLCQDPNTGSYDNTQRYDKAYPGVREIAVLHDFGLGPTTYKDRGGTGNAVVASICPKDVSTTDKSSPGYGYNPAINALVARLKRHLPVN